MGWIQDENRGRTLRDALAESVETAKSGVAAHWRRAVSVVLTATLCSQALLGSGVSVAFAQTVEET
ncbi:hypothetical protein H6A16_04000 [Collinsella tanakaei]|uniref:hypothetical protein n=1 Tax=Collinsella tanakaei TaxID=626935 RepID=UPI00195C239B|nr:hypothetical protein [Collinsella tanakaei]MBM6778660.1 hypothetical protein [Collinsella tanakaei]